MDEKDRDHILREAAVRDLALASLAKCDSLGERVVLQCLSAAGGDIFKAREMFVSQDRSCGLRFLWFNEHDLSESYSLHLGELYRKGYIVHRGHPGLYFINQIGIMSSLQGNVLLSVIEPKYTDRLDRKMFNHLSSVSRCDLDSWSVVLTLWASPRPLSHGDIWPAASGSVVQMALIKLFKIGAINENADLNNDMVSESLDAFEREDPEVVD